MRGLGPIKDAFVARFGGRKLDSPAWLYCAQLGFLLRG